MSGIMNESQVTNIKEYEFDNPPIQKIDSLIDNSFRDCNNKYFHTFDHICEYDLIFTIIGNNETVNFTISDKSMGLYELNKTLTIARQRGFIFNQTNKLTIKGYSNLCHINIHHYLKLRIPITHRKFLLKFSKNRDYIQTHCNDKGNPFHFACRQWYLYKNPQCDMV